MATYTSFQQVLNAAQQGTLSLGDWIFYMRDYGSNNNGTSNYVTLDRANQLLAALKQTEPNDAVTKLLDEEITYGQPFSFRNDSKEVIPPKIPSLSQGIFGSTTDFLNTLGQKNTWTRVAEFAIGALLLAIGANALIKGGK